MESHHPALVRDPLCLLSHAPPVTPRPASDTSRTRWNCCRVVRPGPGDRPASPPRHQRPHRQPAPCRVDRPGLRVDRLVPARGFPSAGHETRRPRGHRGHRRAAPPPARGSAPLRSVHPVGYHSWLPNGTIDVDLAEATSWGAVACSNKSVNGCVNRGWRRRTTGTWSPGFKAAGSRTRRASPRSGAQPPRQPHRSSTG